VHGAADETVSVREGERLAELAGGVAELLVLPAVNHAFDTRHPMAEPSPAVERATAATVALFTERLGG
jgi:fermentation-respiration switch protein FrsA (DUF1100 family)